MGTSPEGTKACLGHFCGSQEMFIAGSEHIVEILQLLFLYMQDPAALQTLVVPRLGMCEWQSVNLAEHSRPFTCRFSLSV